MNFPAIYGLCGLAFFTMGVALAARASAFGPSALRNRLAAVAAFGCLYGLFEWAAGVGAADPNWPASKPVLFLGAAAFTPLFYVAALEFGWSIRRAHGVIAGAALVWFAAATGLNAVALEALMRWAWAAPTVACFALALLRGPTFAPLRALDPQRMRWLVWIVGGYALTLVFTTPGDFFPASLLNSANFQALFGVSPLIPGVIIALSALPMVLLLLSELGAKQSLMLKTKAEENKARLRAILDAEPECVKVLDADGVVLDINRAGLQMIGASSLDEVRGESVYRLIKPQYHDAFGAALAACFSGQSTTIEFEIVGLNGVHRHMEQNAAPLFSPGDAARVERVVAITRDVTERIMSEAALRQSARMLEQAQRIASMGCWEWNIVTNDLVWSDEIYRIFGLKPAEFGVSYPAFLERVHPDDRAHLEESVRAAVTEGAVYDINHRIVRPDGAVRMVREQGDIDYDANGAPLRMLGVVHDITEQMRSEAALKQSTRMLEQAQRIASVGCWEWNLVTGHIVWSEEAYRIYDLEPAEFTPTYEAFLERVHPDDRVKVEDAVRAALQEGVARPIQHRILLADGRTRVVHQQGEVDYSADGTPLRMIGVTQDITEVARMGAKLRASEERLTGILNIAPEAVIVTDANAVITMFSAGAERIFGYSAKEVIGRNVACLMPEHFRIHHDQHVAAFRNAPVASRRMDERGEVFGLRKNGETFPAHASISRLVTPSGVVFTTILRDVSAEKAAHEELRNAKEGAEAATRTAQEAVARLEEAQSIANLGSWEWLPDTGVFTCSQQTLRILGRTGVHAGAMSLAETLALHADDAPQLSSALRLGLASATPLNMHHRIVRPSGEERFVHTLANPVRDETGRVRKLVGVLHDLTELRSMEDLLKAVREAGEKARAESAAKTDFLSHMSHELRTPLNAIIGYSELMLEGAAEEGRQAEIDDHERVIGAARHLLKLITGLLDLSKVEAGRMEAEVRRFEAAEIAMTAADTVRPTAEGNGNRLVVVLADGLGDAHNDSFRLSQCLLNLLSNAAKFTRDGEITLRAARERQADREWLVFEVEDTGVGMSEAQLARVFEPFTQAEAATARTYGGTGLGLTITKRLAKLMGGDVSVRSVKGQGTTFTLRVAANLEATQRAVGRAA
jgi:PAS domain S-box-containing protein